MRTHFVSTNVLYRLILEYVNSEDLDNLGSLVLGLHLLLRMAISGQNFVIARRNENRRGPV